MRPTPVASQHGGTAATATRLAIAKVAVARAAERAAAALFCRTASISTRPSIVTDEPRAQLNSGESSMTITACNGHEGEVVATTPTSPREPAVLGWVVRVRRRRQRESDRLDGLLGRAPGRQHRRASPQRHLKDGVIRTLLLRTRLDQHP